MTDNQEQEAIGVFVKFVFCQLSFYRIHSLACKISVNFNLKSYSDTKLDSFFHQNQ